MKEGVVFTFSAITSFTQGKIRDTEEADCENLTSLGQNVFQSVGALSDD